MASTSSTAANSDYDVFINHRGPDVKKTFASHLYRRLLSHGIKVFLDQPELNQGDYFTTQIDDVIRSASVHVAIFSEGYAQSSWCLNELLQMLDSKGTILPVFYHVKPSELRWTQGREGTYARALEEKKSRYDSSKIENWRNALSQVAGISGFEVEACNGDEGVLVDKVVDEVLKRVKKPVLHVAKYPKGLDDKIEDFENSVLLEQELKPQIVGIVGLGGVGKTTLAKEFFNRKNTDYRQSCFLSDVRDNAGKGCLISLQKKLLKRLNASDKTIESVDDVNEGIGMLKKYLSSTEALVVLDDVDHVDQVDALLPHQTDLHSQSLILITSRNKDVLTKTVESTSIYKLTGLDTPHDKELFCSHAFNQPYPPPGFESLVEKFLKICDGLPLSLKVLGALLFQNDDKCYWQSLLDKLEVPSEIQDKLRISYDSLSKGEQQIFLDIACFFIGEDRDTAIKIWDASGWNGFCGFQNIQNKCLVQVNSENAIKMHDHLRDLGREIAADASLPRRLWRLTEEDDLLQQSSVINDQVRGIRMLPSRDSDSIDDSSEMPWYQRRARELFGNCVMGFCSLRCNADDPFHGTAISLKNLQLVHTKDDLLERILRRTDFSNLLWLRWDNCPYSSLPSWISMKNLRILQVQGSKLETLWKNESQAPLQLRELKIGAPSWLFDRETKKSIGQLNIPKSIGQLKHLERLAIGPEIGLEGRDPAVQIGFKCSGNVNLTKLPEDFCLLQSLKVLVLRGCSEMKSLPECFGNLTNLQHIDMPRCSELERLPDSFGELVQLQYLNLESCKNLTLSNETLGRIRTLEYINLSMCQKIEVFPPQVAHQRSLEKLYFGGTNLNIKELPSFGELSDLEVLNIGGPLLDTLPLSLCSLKNLKQLVLSACGQLKCLPDSLGDLRSLMILRINDCRELKCLPASIGQLTKLTWLRIQDCPLIRELPFKKEVKGERETSSDLEPSIDNCILPCLQGLYVQESGISEVSFAEGICFNLRCLFIRECDDLVEVGTLPNTLTMIDFGFCQNLRKIEFDGLANVQSLILRGCTELEELPGIETLVSLNELSASQCVNLKSIRGLGQLTKLRDLDISGCSELEEVELEGIQHCVSLYTLKASGCVKLKSIQSILGLGQLIKLRLLNVQMCSNLEDLEGIQDCMSLYSLHVSGCVKLKSIRRLGQLTKLRDLDISGCSELEEVEGIQDCMSLYKVSASGCPKLQWNAGVVEQLRQRVTQLCI